MLTNFSLLKQGSKLLASKGFEASDKEAEILLLYAIKKTNIELLGILNQPVNQNDVSLFFSYLKRRLRNEPLEYITKNVFFLNNEYVVTKGVLIPRPETEELCIRSFNFLDPFYQKYQKGCVFEVGFGTGVLAIEHAKRYNNWTVYAWDISKKAYYTALRNKEKHNALNLNLIQKNFFRDPLPDSLVNNFDFVFLVSNPPYIKLTDIPFLEASVRDFEPKSALNGGFSGLVFYKRILRKYLKSKVSLLFEIGYNQKNDLIKFLIKNEIKNWKFYSDFSGHDRVLLVDNHS